MEISEQIKGQSYLMNVSRNVSHRLLRRLSLLLNLLVAAADELNLYSPSFGDFYLSEDQLVLATVGMFLELGLVKIFNVKNGVRLYNFSSYYV